MSGILEQILVAIQANTAALNASRGTPTNTGAPLVAPQASAPLVAPVVAQAAPVGVSADQITALIQPHVGNEAIKTALGVAMRGLGVNALPEAPEHLYGQLYVAFQNVLAQHGVGGAAQVAPPVATSII